jgi:hypothetical protein
MNEGSILEIGVGTGHMIAAAKARGRIVSGTELSPHHRDYVKKHWGIEVTQSLPTKEFDNVDKHQRLRTYRRPVPTHAGSATHPKARRAFYHQHRER